MKITEITHKPQEISNDEQLLMHRIENECSDFVSVMKSHGFLYHGFKGIKKYDYNSPLQFTAASIKNRTPKDTPTWAQIKIDKMLRKAGFEAIRGNSLFCTANVFTASYYGVPYFIFPVNGFKYTYCNMRDLYAAMPALYLKFENPNYNYELFIKDYQFKNTELETALDNNREIYIHGKYIALECEQWGNTVKAFWPTVP